MYQYPRARFVDESSFAEQLEHVKSEIEELEGAEWYGQEMEELIDLQHSVETLIRIAEEKGRMDVRHYRQKVIEKNLKRGYYGGV